MTNKSIFKTDENVKMDDDYFGVGSIIMEGNSSLYIVCGNDSNDVWLMDTKTFLIVPESKTTVIDSNYLTITEARQLTNFSKSCTFTDFTHHSKGLKGFNYQKQLGISY